MIIKAAQQLLGLLTGFEVLNSQTSSIDPTHFEHAETIEAINLANRGTGSVCNLALGNGGNIQVSAIKGGDTIQFVTTSPKNAYAGFGYGKTHSKLSMVTWLTNSTGSYTLQLYSTSSLNITQVPESIYNTTSVEDLGNGMMQYTTTRPRLPGNEADPMDLSLGQAFQVSWVWQTTTGAWPLNYHSDVDTKRPKDYISKLRLEANGDCFEGIQATEGLSRAWRHGIYYTVAWTYLAMIEMWTGRFLRHWWKWRHIIHSVVGTIILVCTLIGWIIMMSNAQWKTGWDNLHSVAGNICTWLILAMLAGGYVLLGLLKLVDLPWNTKYINLARHIHHYFGYFCVVIVQIAVMTGFNRRVFRESQAFAVWMFFWNMMFWGCVLLGGEAYHQYKMRTGVQFKSRFDIQRTMTRAEFDTAVENGEKLCIIEDLVLDVKDYIMAHPGGKFVIEHTIGQDISKFFFGGFSLEDNDNPKTQGYNHTYAAYHICNDLAIAIFERDIPVSTQQVLHDVDKAIDVSPDVKTIYLYSANRSSAFKHHYNDYRTLGKHFRFTIEGDPHFSRHFTICNVMMGKLYPEYLKALQHGTMLPKHVTDHGDQDHRTFTIKNYDRGMSKTFFADRDTIYNIKGPIGKGIMTKPEGLYVAFGAGTGVLTFMDTVAFAARIALNKVHKPRGIDAPVGASQMLSASVNADVFDVQLQVPRDFKFVLYVSFANRETSMGLELCEALDEFCKKHNLDTFRLVTRLSQGYTGAKPPRWDYNYIEQELFRMTDVQKVVVCGPPLISEIFDKAFERIAAKRYKGFTKDKLEVL